MTIPVEIKKKTAIRKTFNFSTLDGLESQLNRLVCKQAIRGTFVERESAALTTLADEWNIPSQAVYLAQYLANGIPGLVVVLLEPTTIRSELEIEQVYEISPTLRHVDETLRFASAGQLNWKNTSIVDVRPFRSHDVRMEDDDQDRRDNDERAYLCFQHLIDELDPSVILVLQCQTTEVENDYARTLSSTVSKCAKLESLKVNGVDRDVVWSFHPSYFSNPYLQQWRHDRQLSDSEESLRRQLLLASNRLSFIVAVHALRNQRIDGLGIAELQRAVRCNSLDSTANGDGLHQVTCARPGERFIASDSLVSKLSTLNIASSNLRTTRCEP